MTIVTGYTGSFIGNYISPFIFGESGVAVNAMGAGQSLIVRMNETTFKAAAGSGSQFVDAAVNGSALTKTIGDQTSTTSWIDDSSAPTYTDGTLLTAYLVLCDATYASRTDVNTVLWQQGNQSRTYVTPTGAGTGEITKAEYKAAFEHLISRWRAEHGSDVQIIISILHRRTSGNDQENYGFQAIREVNLELIDGDVNIHGVEIVDIDLADATHLSDPTGIAEHGTRMGDMTSYALNATDKPDYPLLQSATIDYNEITATFDTDITAPSSGVGQCAGESGGNARTGSALIRTGANTAKLTLGDNQGVRIDDSPYMRVSSGLNSGLASTNADTLNNAGGTLPARSARIAMTSTNVITNIADVKEFWDAKHSTKTFSAGVSVSSIEGLKGAGFETHPSNTNPDYDATAFGGRGGLKGVADTVCMQNIEPFVAGAVHTIFYAVDIPVSPSSNIRMHQFGLPNGSSDTDTSVFGNGANVSYYRNQANGATVIGAGATGGKHVFALRFNSLSSCDVFVDSTSVTTNFNPRDDYSAGTYTALHLFSAGGGSDGLLNGIYGAFGYSDSALTDTEIETIVNELGTEFGITIT